MPDHRPDTYDDKRETMDLNPTRLPVHVLTGFLGSGKTTLLSALVRQPALRDTLVIVNELGEIGFDHLLLTEAREEVIVQLEGGCVCCVMRGDLLRTLEAARKQLATAGGDRFSRVVIETSGMATPDAIVHTLMLDRNVASHYKLGRIVTTFDLQHGSGTLASYAEARAQLAAADTVVLTKSDLVDDRRSAEATAQLDTFNPGARHYSAAEFLEHAATWLDDFSPDELPREADGHGLAHSNVAPFPHTDNIRTFALRCPHPLERRAFNEWMSVRLRFRDGQVLRVKGLVQLADSDQPLFIHGVQQTFHPARALERWPGTQRETHLMFITDGIAREIIEQSFAHYVAPVGA